MGKICIFLRKVSDLSAQIADLKHSSGAEMFPFYSNGHSRICKTETFCIDIPNIPTCRIETSIFTLDESQNISFNLRHMRLACNMTAAELSNKTGVHVATISRYENEKFSYDKIDIDVLSRLSVACNQNENYLLTPFLQFKKYHKMILQQYLIDNNIAKKQLAKLCNVSYTLVKTWFNKEKRSPSYATWQATFKDYTLDWLEHNIN